MIELCHFYKIVPIDKMEEELITRASRCGFLILYQPPGFFIECWFHFSFYT